MTKIKWISDSLIVVLAWVFAYYLRFHTNIVPQIKGTPPFGSYFALSVFIVVIWSGMFWFKGLYQSKRTVSFAREAIEIIKANVLAILVFIAFTYLSDEYKYSRVVLVYFFTLNLIMMIISRRILNKTFKAFRRKGMNQLKVIIVGTGPLARIFRQKLTAHPDLGIKVLGHITSTPTAGSDDCQPILGTVEDLAEIVDRFQLDQLFVALPPAELARLEPHLRNISDGLVDICIVPDVQQFVTLSCSAESLDGVPIIYINDVPLKDSWNRFTKRFFDLTVASLSLALSLPVQLILALLIKLTSKGPVFYSQERMGLDGAIFRMYKFRSMRVDAEEKTGAVWAKEGDDRTTAIGKLARKTSLDELPQLFNVLKGDMSLIGPRPERPVFVKEFSQHIPKYMLRHKVKSGITGWAQVNGWRGNSSLEKRIECDLWYVKNWSLYLDTKILWLTLWKGLINKNAY